MPPPADIQIEQTTGRVTYKGTRGPTVVGYFYPPRLIILQYPESAGCDNIGDAQHNIVEYAAAELRRQAYYVDVHGVAPPECYVTGLPGRKKYFLDWLENRTWAIQRDPDWVTDNIAEALSFTQIYKNVPNRARKRARLKPKAERDKIVRTIWAAAGKATADDAWTRVCDKAARLLHVPRKALFDGLTSSDIDAARYTPNK